MRITCIHYKPPAPSQADMGGMGFIQSNHSRILFNSTMISFNVRRP